jgi:hypothetical protein
LTGIDKILEIQKLGPVGTMTPGLDVESMRGCPQLANSFTATGIKIEVEILFFSELMFNGVIEDQLFVRVGSVFQIFRNQRFIASRIWLDLVRVLFFQIREPVGPCPSFYTR